MHKGTKLKVQQIKHFSSTKINKKKLLVANVISDYVDFKQFSGDSFEFNLQYC